MRVNLINEERYARAFIRGKVHSGWEGSRSSPALRANGIDEETIASCADDFGSPDDEYRSALLELSKAVDDLEETRTQPYMRRLLSRGYSYDLATRRSRLPFRLYIRS